VLQVQLHCLQRVAGPWLDSPDGLAWSTTGESS
jgi:hypothetical protein